MKCTSTNVDTNIDENIHFSNKIIKLCSGKFCRYSTFICITRKLMLLGNKLYELERNKNNSTEEFANDVFQGLNDIIIEVNKTKRSCNKTYNTFFNDFTKYLKLLTYK